MVDLSQVPTPWLFAGIAAAAAMVVWSGTKLTRYGDALGEQYALSRAWVGVILLATITSLPELVVTLSAQLAVSRPRIAMANVCGSNLINLFFFALLDIQAGPGPVSARLDRRLVRPAMMGLLSMGIAAVGFLLPYIGLGKWVPCLGWPVTVAIVATCLYAMWKTERTDEAAEEAEKAAEAGEAAAGRGVAVRFAAFAGVLVVTGIGTVVLCDALVGRPLHVGGATFSLGESVIGVIGLALMTSLPELVVCLSAVRLGAIDMAMGNLFGSNIFNIILLPLAHLVRPTRSFWSAAEPIHFLPLGGAMVLTCIIAAGIRTRPKRAFLRMGWDGVLVALIGGSAYVLVAVLGVAS